MTKFLAAVLAAATLATAPAPAFAQDQSSEARLRKIEAEIRALQRNVFPQNGDGRFFEPQISPDGTQRPATTSNPASTTAVTDILARLDAIEQQLQRLTALTEENQNALSQFETRIAALESAPSTVVAAADPVPSGALPAAAGGAAGAASGASREVATQLPETPTGPSAERLAKVRAIAKPQTDDPADDDYSYGYRLWEAGLFPEARQALSAFVEKYPNHSRATYGRNLLGRAFLDDGMPDEAAKWFLRNYNTDKQARRAPDSLLYLAESMIALKDTKRACIALAEFAETYPAVATGRLSEQYQANRRKVTCS